jgi:hypothetical protein
MTMLLTEQRRIVNSCLATIFLVAMNSLHANVITTGCADINASCTLDELVGGGSVSIGNHLYDDWIVDDFSTYSTELSAIEVSILNDELNNSGLLFKTNGEFNTVGYDVIDFTLSFRVSTLDGSERIKKSHLEITEHAFGAGNFGGVIDIAEDILDADGNLIGETNVLADSLPPSLFDLSDSDTFLPKSEIFIEKTFFITGDSQSDNVSLDSFSQRFHSASIPEPETLWLMIIGLSGVFVARRQPDL